MSYPKTIAEFSAAGHHGLAALIAEEQRKGGHKLDLTKRVSSCFTWNNTKDGPRFWNKIDQGNFDVFYEKYPEFKNQPGAFSYTRLTKETFLGKKTLKKDNSKIDTMGILPEIKKLAVRKKK
jgi:hypothetical protein